MLRLLTLFSILFLAAPSVGAPLYADPLMRLEQPSQTVTFEQDGLNMIAFFTHGNEVLDLTILITDPDGEAMRTRIGLRDRQHHTLLLHATNDTDDTTRIEFLRTGGHIEMVASSHPTDTDLASHQIKSHF